MRLYHIVPTLAAILLVVALACGGDEQKADQPSPTLTAATGEVPGFPVTIADSNGKLVTLEAQPQRIVALAPAFVEILFAIGAGDSVVAVDENTDFPPEAAARTKISGFQPSVEGIAALGPDLVIIFFDPGDLQSSLEALGFPVLFLKTPGSVEGVFEQIKLLGRAMGRTDEAEELAADMKADIEAITAELADIQQGPRVFHELDPTLFTTCPGEFVHDMYAVLKAQNIASGASGLCQMTQEAVIAADPEVIILADEPAGESPQTVAARPGWDGITAVKEGRVYAVDPDIVSRPGPRLVEAMRTLAKLLYPERFE